MLSPTVVLTQKQFILLFIVDASKCIRLGAVLGFVCVTGPHMSTRATILRLNEPLLSAFPKQEYRKSRHHKHLYQKPAVTEYTERYSVYSMRYHFPIIIARTMEQVNAYVEHMVWFRLSRSARALCGRISSSESRGHAWHYDNS